MVAPLSETVIPFLEDQRHLPRFDVLTLWRAATAQGVKLPHDAERRALLRIDELCAKERKDSGTENIAFDIIKPTLKP